MKSSLWQLIIAQLKEWMREPGSVFWSFAFPLLMIVAFGIAFSERQEIVKDAAMVKQPGDTVFEEIIENGKLKDSVYTMRFENENTLDIVYHFRKASWDEAIIMAKRGKVDLILSQEDGAVSYHYDPLNPEAELIQMQLAEFFDKGHIGGSKENVQFLSAQGTRYIDFLVPGLITMGIMMSIMWGVSYALIEKRSKKLLRRMVATPMKKSYFLLSQIITRLMLTMTEAAVILWFASMLFNVQIQGSVPGLILLFLAGNFCFMGIAILISSRTANTQVGNGLISFITMPMMILSGIFFSYQNFPDWAVAAIRVLPLTKFTDEVRAVVNEGATFAQILDGFSVLTIAGIILFFTGLKVYKWY